MATSSSTDCVIPKTENDISNAWIQSTLGLAPAPNTLSIQGNVQDGFGFLSNLVRVSFKTEEGHQENILVKLLPTSEEFKQVTRSEKFDEQEIRFYEIIRPRLIEVAPEFARTLCKFCCAKKGCFGSDEYASMIIMQDLKPLGYAMLNPNSTLWEENLIQVVETIAEFHFVGQSLERASNAKCSELFPFLVLNSWDGLFELGKSYLPKLESFLQVSEIPAEVRDAYKLLAPDFENQFKAVLEACSKHPCLVHGDLWAPNIMIAEGSNLPVKFIDWQLIGYRDPAIEVIISILTCLPNGKITRENVDKFSQIYLQKVKALGMECGRSDSEFQQFFNTWAIAYAYIWFLLSIEALWSDQQRLKDGFTIFQQEYKVVDFLRSQLS